MNVAALPAAPRLAPVVPGWPILGSAIPMARDPLAFLTAAYRRLGPIFRVRVPGRVITILAGPEANQFMSKDSETLLRSTETWQPFVGLFGAKHNVISSDGELHSRLRKIMKRSHGRSMAAPHLPMLTEVVRAGALALPVGRRVVVISALRPMITEQLGRLLAGRAAAERTDDLVRVNREATGVFVVGARPAWTLRLPRYRRALARVLALGDEVLRAHRETPRDPAASDLIDDLLAAAAADPSLLSEADLRMAAIGPFIAGLDTVANACAFLLYELLTRDDVRARVVAEVDELFAAGPPTLEGLRSLRTLHAAAMEALRLHPISPALARNAARDFSFAGHDVREGDPILVATGVSHFLPELWDRPAEFDLQRFEGPRKPGAYAPYGLGPHTCLGASLADVQVVILVATLLHTVELRLDPAGYRLRTILSPGPTPDAGFGMTVVGQRANR